MLMWINAQTVVLRRPILKETMEWSVLFRLKRIDAQENFMYENEKVEQRRVTVDAPGEHREIVTERTQSVPRESSITATTVAIIVIAAVMVVGAIFYFISSKNANEAANRNANLAAANQTNTAQ